MGGAICCVVDVGAESCGCPTRRPRVARWRGGDGEGGATMGEMEDGGARVDDDDPPIARSQGTVEPDGAVRASRVRVCQLPRVWHDASVSGVWGADVGKVSTEHW